MLLRLRLWLTAATAASKNKSQASLLSAWVAPWLLHLPLAGRGGEGKKLGSSVALGSGGGEGVHALAFLRGAWQGPALSLSLSLLPPTSFGGKGSKRTAAWQTATSLFFSCGLQRLRPRLDSTILLAEHGGEGEDGGALLRVRWSCRPYLDADAVSDWSVISTAFPPSTTLMRGK
jgi:hypothetical protein